MRVKYFISAFLLSAVLFSCTKEYDCADPQIPPSFIHFSASDIDTFVLRKFKQGDNYQNLVDTFMVKFGYNGIYETSNDTTTVILTDGKSGIKAGFDWQLFIPAKNKTVFISDIVSEKKTGRESYGIFSLDHIPGCVNKIFSLKLDNQVINFSNSDTARHSLFIHI